MPALSVLGVPVDTPKETLRALRAELIGVVEEAMGIETGMTRVFFPTDMLGDPDEGQDTLIWVFLYTGMFRGQPVEKAKATTKAIAETVFAAFGGLIGVEVFVRECDPDTKTIIESDNW